MEGNAGVEVVGGMRPRRRRKLTIRECRQRLEDDAFNRMVSPESVVREALRLVQETGIVFIDEIDKICQRRGEYLSRDASAEGVQVCVVWCHCSPVFFFEKSVL